MTEFLYSVITTFSVVIQLSVALIFALLTKPICKNLFILMCKWLTLYLKDLLSEGHTSNFKLQICNHPFCTEKHNRTFHWDVQVISKSTNKIQTRVITAFPTAPLVWTLPILTFLIHVSLSPNISLSHCNVLHLQVLLGNSRDYVLSVLRASEPVTWHLPIFIFCCCSNLHQM